MAGVWRDGALLVVTNGSRLPQRCPKCNSASTGVPLTLKIVRREELGIHGSIMTVILEKFRGSHYTGPVRMHVYFCSRHRRRRQVLLLVSAALLVLGVGGAWACCAVDPKDGMDGLFLLPGGVAVASFFALFTTAIGHNPWFRPKRFDGRQVWLKGACRAFLEGLPPFSGGDARARY